MARSPDHRKYLWVCLPRFTPFGGERIPCMAAPGRPGAARCGRWSRPRTVGARARVRGGARDAGVRGTTPGAARFRGSTGPGAGRDGRAARSEHAVGGAGRSGRAAAHASAARSRRHGRGPARPTAGGAGPSLRRTVHCTGESRPTWAALDPCDGAKVPAVGGAGPGYAARPAERSGTLDPPAPVKVSRVDPGPASADSPRPVRSSAELTGGAGTFRFRPTFFQTPATMSEPGTTLSTHHVTCGNGLEKAP